MSGTLYLVPTPIGNLGDISRRMADTLAQADLRLKSSRTDKRVVLEQTAARLIVLAKGG